MPTAARPARADIAALTPADRNRYADLLRVAAIVVVVLGHWLLAVVTVRDGRLEGANLLALVPATQWLTWVFQVMPVFFFVGGYANAAAWTRARRRGDGYADWVRARAARLLRPTVPVLVLWVTLAAALAVVGVPAGTLRLGTQLVVV
ncbi:MAG: acyltransferase, partial [Actinomycetota bacterium]|nr:acyltransferase [Actinomycetota bacterium]